MDLIKGNFLCIHICFYVCLLVYLSISPRSTYQPLWLPGELPFGPETSTDTWHVSSHYGVSSDPGVYEKVLNAGEQGGSVDAGRKPVAGAQVGDTRAMTDEEDLVTQSREEQVWCGHSTSWDSGVCRDGKEQVWLKPRLYLGVCGDKTVFKDKTLSFPSKAPTALMGRSQWARKLAKQKDLQKPLFLKSRSMEPRGRRGWRGRWMQRTVRASLQKEGCSACPGPCPAPPLEESNTVTWSSKVLEQTRGTRQPSDCTSASLAGGSLNSCLSNSFQLFVGVGLYIDLLSSVKNQFYMILLFSEVFFISAELLILTKKKSILAFHLWF